MPFINSELRKIYYESFGDSANPCLIMISGLSGQLVGWPKDLLSALVEQGFYVIVFDNRDVGLSSFYDHLALPNMAEIIAIRRQGGSFVPPYTLDDMASDVICLMNGLNIKSAHIAGLSMGGKIAQLLAMHHPERCLSLSCIATSSGNRNLPPPSQRVAALMASSVPQTDDLEAYLQYRLPIYRAYHHPDDHDEQEAREYLQVAFLRAYHPAGSTRQLLAVMAAQSRSEQLRQVSLPTLIFHGDYDPVFPIEHAEELADVIPNSQLVVVDKLGHGLPQRIRADLARLIGEHR